jgi:hypothetical protein
MRNMPYKVQFQAPNHKGWIDGYATAKTAKAEVERVNAATERTGWTAKYLGHNGKPEQRAQG